MKSLWFVIVSLLPTWKNTAAITEKIKSHEVSNSMSSDSSVKLVKWIALCHQRNNNEVPGREKIDSVWSRYKIYKQEQFCESDTM